MYSGGAQDNSRLAEKLRCEYRNRGAALSGVSATPTSELMARAQMGRDPRANVSEEAFDDRIHGRDFRYGAKAAANRSGARPQTNGAFRASDARAGVGTGTASRPGRAPSGARTARTEKNGKAGGRRSTSGMKTEERASRDFFAEDEDFAPEEIRVERKKMPKAFLALLAFCTVMIMLIILSIAQFYQANREVSGLESTIDGLKETIDELELKLDEKNDVRLIEQIATMEMGMVKEDAVQRKYVSMSDGERVDLIEDPDAAEDVGGGTMLSSIFSALSDLFEYFR